MKNNEFTHRHPVLARTISRTLLVVLVAGISTSAEAAATSSASAFERKGAQALIENTPVMRIARGLPSEMDIPELGELARAYASQPKTTHHMNTVLHGVSSRVAIHEVGTGTQVIVCLHGLFGQSSNWKYIAGALGQDYQLWLVDLPGSGASDSLKAGKADLTTYGPPALADRVLQALEVRLAARPDVTRVLIAGHSLGGMIVLRMFSDDGLRARYSEVLARVEGLVLFAPCDVVVTQATDDWLAMLALNATKVRIGDSLGLLQSAMNKSIRGGFCDASLASRELSEDGRRVLVTGSQRRATQAMMRSAIPWREFGKQPDWPAVEELEVRYESIQLPCLIVWGQRDQTLSVSMGYKIKDQLPNARLVVVPESMHLLPMERPAVCADLIRKFDGQLKHKEMSVARSVTTLPRQSLRTQTVIAGSSPDGAAPTAASARFDQEPVGSVMLAR